MTRVASPSPTTVRASVRGTDYGGIGKCHHGTKLRIAVVVMSAAIAAFAAGCGDDGETSNGGQGAGGNTSSGSGTGAAGGTTSTGAPPLCGNGSIDDQEVCDDGNTEDGDGCNADCQPSGRVLFATVTSLPPDSMTSSSLAGLTDGSFVVVGRYGPNPPQGFYLRFDSDGAELGATVVSATGSATSLAYKSVTAAPDGGFLALGTLGGTSCGIVTRYDASGAALWTVDQNDVGCDRIQNMAMAGDIAVVAGSLPGAGPSAVDREPWLRGLNADGVAAWTLSGMCSFCDRVTTRGSMGEYALVTGTDSVANGPDDAWVAAIDKDGAVVWSETFGGTGQQSASVIAFEEGFYLLVSDNSDRRLLRYDDSFNQISEGPYPFGSNSRIEHAFPNGELLASDFSMVGISVGRYDSAGAERWVQHFGDMIDGHELSSGVNHAVTTLDGGVAFVTGTPGPSQGVFLPMIVRLAP